MKISVNKILYHWFTKEPVDNKSKSFQVSLMWQPLSEIYFSIDWSRSYGHIFTFNLTLFGLIRLIYYKDKEMDHAGSTFQLHILGLDIEYTNRDIRHWDDENDCWEIYENESDELKEYYKIMDAEVHYNRGNLNK